MYYFANPILSTFKVFESYVKYEQNSCFLVFQCFKTVHNSISFALMPCKYGTNKMMYSEYLFGDLSSFQGEHFTHTDTIFWLCFYVFVDLE